MNSCALLLDATALADALWGRRGWLPAIFPWACLPRAHVVTPILDLPDTLQPDTTASIFHLVALSLVVALSDAGGRVLIHRLSTEAASARFTPHSR